MAINQKPYIIEIYAPVGQEKTLLEKLHGAQTSAPVGPKQFVTRLISLLTQVNSGNIDLAILPKAMVDSGFSHAKVDFDFADQPSADDYIQVGTRRFTFKSSNPNSAADEVLIGADLAETLNNLVSKINASTDAVVTEEIKAQLKDADSITCTACKPGYVGNMFKADKSGANITVTGAINGCFSGGVQVVQKAFGGSVLA